MGLWSYGWQGPRSFRSACCLRRDPGMKRTRKSAVQHSLGARTLFLAVIRILASAKFEKEPVAGVQGASLVVIRILALAKFQKEPVAGVQGNSLVVIRILAEAKFE